MTCPSNGHQEDMPYWGSGVGVLMCCAGTPVAHMATANKPFFLLIYFSTGLFAKWWRWQWVMVMGDDDDGCNDNDNSDDDDSDYEMARWCMWRQ